MRRYIRSTCLGLCILLTLSCWDVSADDTATPETPTIEYQRYDDPYDPEGQIYHQFLPSPAPGGLLYHTRLKASVNIDDTSEKETVVSILADGRGSLFDGNWGQAYLLLTTTEADGSPKKKELFKLFDVDDYDSDVPMKIVELQNPPFIFTLIPKDADKPHGIPFKFIDLTGDGILDIWVEFGYAVAVISFQNGEFKEIFSSYSYAWYQDPEYFDMDNNGTYEIKIPHRAYLDGFTRSAHPIWMNLYEWDGTAYVLNNEKFYAHDNDISFQLLSAYNNDLRLHYNYQLARETKDPGQIYRLNPVYIQKVDTSHYFAVYDFYIGLVHYYRGKMGPAQAYLQHVATEAKNQDYRKAADAMLKEIWNETDDKKQFVDFYRRHLIRQHGDIPEVHLFVAGKKKMLSGGFTFPADEDEFLMFHEARYVLWRNETVLSDLEKVRKAKAEGTPFHLIDWDNDEE